MKTMLAYDKYLFSGCDKTFRVLVLRSFPTDSVSRHLIIVACKTYSSELATN